MLPHWWQEKQCSNAVNTVIRLWSRYFFAVKQAFWFSVIISLSVPGPGSLKKVLHICSIPAWYENHIGYKHDSHSYYNQNFLYCVNIQYSSYVMIAFLLYPLCIHSHGLFFSPSESPLPFPSCLYFRYAAGWDIVPYPIDFELGPAIVYRVNPNVLVHI